MCMNKRGLHCVLSFCSLTQGPHSKFLSGEGGGRDVGGWAKEECVDEILGLEGHAWKFSFFSLK